MNVTSQQINDRLADIDWELAGPDNLDVLGRLLLDSDAALAEFGARSRVLGAWSVATLTLVLLPVVSGEQHEGPTLVLIVFTIAVIVTLVRSYGARRELQQRLEATYGAIDDAAHRFPCCLPELTDGRPSPVSAHGLTQE